MYNEKYDYKKYIGEDKSFWDEMKKESRIWDYAVDLGYHPKTTLDLINIIKENNIDISKFELPYDCKTLQEWMILEEQEKKKHDGLVEKISKIKIAKTRCSM